MNELYFNMTQSCAYINMTVKIVTNEYKARHECCLMSINIWDEGEVML